MVIPITDHEGPGGCGFKGPQYTATALGRGMVASTTLGRLYPRGENPVHILEEAEWTPDPV